MAPLLSVVITSYTTEVFQDICELLDAIGAQTHPNVEVIYVTERSRELQEMVSEYARGIGLSPFAAVFNDGQPGASVARNLGIGSSQREIVAFLDDDAIPFPDWAEEMVKTYQDDSIVGVTGAALPLWEDSSMAWFPEEFYWIVGGTAWGDWSQQAEVRNVWTMNASFRRGALEQSGGFSTSIGPMSGSMEGRKRELSEDLELSLRVRRSTGKKIVFNPKIKVYHRVPRSRMRLGYIVRWAYWMGYSKHLLKTHYSGPASGDNILSQESRLLKRILTGLLPETLKGLVRSPGVSIRRLLVTGLILFFVLLGYVSHSVTSLGRRRDGHPPAGADRSS